MKQSKNVSINSLHMPSQAALHSGGRLVDALKVTLRGIRGRDVAEEAEHTFLTSVEGLTVFAQSSYQSSPRELHNGSHSQTEENSNFL